MLLALNIKRKKRMKNKILDEKRENCCHGNLLLNNESELNNPNCLRILNQFCDIVKISAPLLIIIGLYFPGFAYWVSFIPEIGFFYGFRVFFSLWRLKASPKAANPKNIASDMAWLYAFSMCLSLLSQDPNYFKKGREYIERNLRISTHETNNSNGDHARDN